ncbi:MAG TPA: glycosyltransferase family 4 protein [Anaeromyxobacteraceae bacterium]|nr:glycosyltransferase family 4 protein [Anaeromyxobacteraceae bacterium]
MIDKGARRTAIIVARLGPYHVARLAAAGAALGRESCTAIEVAARSREYAWDPVEAEGFRRRTLIQGRDYEDVPPWERTRAMREGLDEERPDVVGVSGWGFPEARAAVRWCRQNGRVAILMSESQERDKERRWLTEALKRQIIREFDSALVGGDRHVDYLVRLGMERSRIVTGYDVIDNDYFARESDAVREDAAGRRSALALPRDYFLSSARFVPKKNLPTLLEAYALYQQQMAGAAWDLVLLGDGPLMPQILELRSRLGLEKSVFLPGFKQYQELPTFYGLARAFVLPSTSEQWGLVVNEAMAAGLPVLVSQVCGSAELVHEGENGYRFDPTNPVQLAGLMETLTRDEHRLRVMGLASQRIVQGRGPLTFGEGLLKAIEIGEAYLAARGPRPLPNPALWI